MSLYDGYLSDNENNYSMKNKRKKYRKKKTNKNRKIIKKNKTFKKKIPKQYVNSIYYDPDNYDSIMTQIMKSPLMDNNSDDDDYDYDYDLNNNNNEFNNIFNELNHMSISNKNNTNNDSYTRTINISINKSYKNGKPNNADGKIIVNNTRKPYIKEYSYKNGITNVKKIKR